MTEMQSAPFHAVVWIDHHQARIIRFDADHSVESTVRPQHPVRHLHHKANSIGSGHARIDQAYFREVACFVGDAGSILLTGPGSAKLEWRKFIEEHQPSLAGRIAEVRTLDHPSDGELLALARKLARAADRMGPQRDPRRL